MKCCACLIPPTCGQLLVSSHCYMLLPLFLAKTDLVCASDNADLSRIPTSLASRLQWTQKDVILFRIPLSQCFFLAHCLLKGCTHQKTTFSVLIPSSELIHGHGKKIDLGFQSSCNASFGPILGTCKILILSVLAINWELRCREIKWQPCILHSVENQTSSFTSCIFGKVLLLFFSKEVYIAEILSSY